MNQVKPPPVGDTRLWIEVRRLESAWRATGDIELALLDLMIVTNQQAKKVAGERQAGERQAGESYATSGKYPIPIPPCTPPAPCVLSLEDLLKHVRMIKTQTGEAVKEFEAQIAEAKKLGIKEVTFRLTQDPSYPEAPVMAGAGTDK